MSANVRHIKPIIEDTDYFWLDPIFCVKQCGWMKVKYLFQAFSMLMLSQKIIFRVWQKKENYT